LIGILGHTQALGNIMSSNQKLCDGQIKGNGQPAKRGPYSATRNHPRGLTRKEAEVLALLVDGANNLTIAAKLKRSRRTVEHHVSAILTKLGVESRMEAVLLALKPPKGSHSKLPRTSKIR
jgi:DNA-binding NarL/FixJ family response regulator